MESGNRVWIFIGRSVKTLRMDVRAQFHVSSLCVSTCQGERRRPPLIEGNEFNDMDEFHVRVTAHGYRRAVSPDRIEPFGETIRVSRAGCPSSRSRSNRQREP